MGYVGFGAYKFCLEFRAAGAGNGPEVHEP